LRPRRRRPKRILQQGKNRRPSKKGKQKEPPSQQTSHLTAPPPSSTSQPAASAEVVTLEPKHLPQNFIVIGGQKVDFSQPHESIKGREGKPPGTLVTFGSHFTVNQVIGLRLFAISVAGELVVVIKVAPMG